MTVTPEEFARARQAVVVARKGLVTAEANLQALKARCDHPLMSRYHDGDDTRCEICHSAMR